ncbi:MULTISPECIES: hypothetical protein [unclassified Micromonospora]|uniref:hypothetical protein n=1 Tax=unclassified Micromonospora TaxID=2617518 RepID=UPI000F478D5E|nr:hypothetical protein [Micromonospora sp. Llam0]ROO62392.1 hypothetical protein EDC02_4369 [Micromonospora sp. Llam0]
MSTADRWLTVIALVSVPTVMFGGYSLMRLAAARKLTDFQLSLFRAGHAHAGVLLVLTLTALSIAARAGLSDPYTWVVGALLAAGTISQSGGFFLHAGIGRPGQWSVGNTLTVLGAGQLTVALLLLAYAVATS